MPTTETEIDGRWSSRTTTGRDDWVNVITRWSDEEDAYVTTVSQRADARWKPLEFHTSDTDDAARTTHRKAARRHPASGNYRTLPRSYNENNKCTRCGEDAHENHHPDCKE